MKLTTIFYSLQTCIHIRRLAVLLYHTRTKESSSWNYYLKQDSHHGEAVSLWHQQCPGTSGQDRRFHSLIYKRILSSSPTFTPGDSIFKAEKVEKVKERLLHTTQCHDQFEMSWWRSSSHNNPFIHTLSGLSDWNPVIIPHISSKNPRQSTNANSNEQVKLVVRVWLAYHAQYIPGFDPIYCPLLTNGIILSFTKPDAWKSTVGQNLTTENILRSSRQEQ